jgi:Legionella pneumophila major outer membrane protein precursor
MLKKTALACFVMAFAGTVSAAMYSPAPEPTCTPGGATVPCAEKKWDIGVQALYLEASYDADYGYIGRYQQPTVLNSEFYQDYDHHHGWGYKLEGSYHFNTGNDITIDWSHVDHDTLQTFNLGNSRPAPFPPAPPIPGPLPPSSDVFYTTLSYVFDQANVVLAQHVDNGLHHNVRFYGGAQVAQIRNDQDTRFASYFGLPTGTFPSHFLVPAWYTVHVDSKFIGVGATGGTDYSYDFGNGLSLTASGKGSILYGSSKVNYRVTNTFAAGVIAPSAYASKKAIVPEIEGKVGVNYAFQAAQGTMNVMAGWQVINYFNALQRFLYPASTVLVAPPFPAPAVPAAATGATGIVESDFALQGPYFGLKWVGNA